VDSRDTLESIIGMLQSLRIKAYEEGYDDGYEEGRVAWEQEETE